MAANIYQCSYCGKTVNLDQYESNRPFYKRMAQARVCFECEFWMRYVENPIPDTYIVSGKMMRFIPIHGWVHGNARRVEGMRFAYDMHTEEIVCNLERKVLGTVPPQFRELLPDDYRWITKNTYERILFRQYEFCDMKGCYDRYNCFWYNAEKMEADGPWNQLPKNYKPGMELCESFINKNTMYDVQFD